MQISLKPTNGFDRLRVMKILRPVLLCASLLLLPGCGYMAPCGCGAQQQQSTPFQQVSFTLAAGQSQKLTLRAPCESSHAWFARGEKVLRPVRVTISPLPQNRAEVTFTAATGREYAQAYARQAHFSLNYTRADLGPALIVSSQPPSEQHRRAEEASIYLVLVDITLLPPGKKPPRP